MRSASDDVEIFYLDDMEEEIAITEMSLKRQDLEVDIRFFLDDALMLNELDRRLKAALAPPGLIVSDLNMPGKGGLYVVQCLRANVAYQDIALGICTSSENPADHEAAFCAGADFVAAKPFDGETLAHICRKTGRFQLIQKNGGKAHFRVARGS